MIWKHTPITDTQSSGLGRKPEAWVGTQAMVSAKGMIVSCL